jgi:hypothetical protein
LRYSPGSLRTPRKAREAARNFAELVGRVVNCTISQAPISFVEVEGDKFEGYVAHAPQRFPAPLPLGNGSFLYLYQRLGLRRDEQYLTTLEYRYSYQASARDDSWVVRYEYEREPADGYPYPRCHLHVNADPQHYDGAKPFDELHLPAGERVTVEMIVRHLIAEQGMTPISKIWEQTVMEAERAFAEIQHKRSIV